MDNAIIAGAVGGILGTVLTIIWNYINIFVSNKVTRQREFDKWLLSERHKASVEILKVVALDPNGEELDKWTNQLRDASVRLQLLYPSGCAPEPLKSTLEEIFQFAKKKKQGIQSDNWKSDFKDFTTKLRCELAKSLSN
ncbi:hypothetical protein [Aliivibrio fischeri]|uniref:hypothetical protein n=1 Tax=Aliivibrio fischeri TaxID=668 RepID=UPI0012D9778D|nr:hypothetical protein [Aliivibrio fischeri]MUJ21358.1 hypothetical protein [Aliivibrio fischeri]